MFDFVVLTSHSFSQCRALHLQRIRASGAGRPCPAQASELGAQGGGCRHPTQLAQGREHAEEHEDQREAAKSEQPEGYWGGLRAAVRTQVVLPIARLE